MDPERGVLSVGADTLPSLRDEATLAWATVDLEKRNDGARRFAYYEQIEQKVMKAIYEGAEEAGVRYWPFHDGVSMLDAGRRINREATTQFVREQTGYSILLDEKSL